jgi:tetratricopeptide (TPR) repeat protein
LRQPQQQWYDAVMSGHWAFFQGDFDEAERLAQEALRVGRRPSDQDAGISYRLSQFALHRERGGLETVEEAIRRAAAEYPGYRSFRCLVLLLDCELGQDEQARSEFEALAADDFAFFPPDGEWLFCLSLLAEVASYLQDDGRAASLHRLLVPYARLNALASGEIPIGCVSRYLGIAATTTRKWDAAAGHFEDAIEINGTMGARPWVAHSQHDYGRMLLARGDADEAKRARELLATALETYRELGMKPWTERAQEDLAAVQ